mmetsp:Transcript_45096/g.125016  ORF Transcript_45096/g.125016 Transcript_45096/m.125016 type:complete len:403 (+) Transcript_45096:1577-2785(+)
MALPFERKLCAARSAVHWGVSGTVCSRRSSLDKEKVNDAPLACATGSWSLRSKEALLWRVSEAHLSFAGGRSAAGGVAASAATSTSDAFRGQLPNSRGVSSSAVCVESGTSNTLPLLPWKLFRANEGLLLWLDNSDVGGDAGGEGDCCVTSETLSRGALQLIRGESMSCNSSEDNACGVGGDLCRRSRGCCRLYSPLGPWASAAAAGDSTPPLVSGEIHGQPSSTSTSKTTGGGGSSDGEQRSPPSRLHGDGDMGVAFLLASWDEVLRGVPEPRVSLMDCGEASTNNLGATSKMPVRLLSKPVNWSVRRSISTASDMEGFSSCLPGDDCAHTIPSSLSPRPSDHFAGGLAFASSTELAEAPLSSTSVSLGRRRLHRARRQHIVVVRAAPAASRSTGIVRRCA